MGELVDVMVHHGVRPTHPNLSPQVIEEEETEEEVTEEEETEDEETEEEET
jgi:hypothetical protein